MVYNKEHDRWVTEDGLVYRYSNKQRKLILCIQTKNKAGYLYVRTKIGRPCTHRLVWETFKGELPKGMEIDHINTIRNDNRIDNLRIVSHKENMNNIITKENRSRLQRKDFGNKFFEHYKMFKRDNHILYMREYHFYIKNGKCSWE